MDDSTRELLECLYQFVGAHNGSELWLDTIRAAIEGKPFNTDELLRLETYCGPN